MIEITPMSTTTTTPTVTSTTTTVPATPVAPTTATPAQVAAHNDVLTKAITAIEGLPHTLANDEQYLNLQAQTLETWVTAKHVKTRILETIAITAAVSILLTWIACHIL